MNRDAETQARIEDHWAASERGDTRAEHEIYAADAVLDYPQSGERFRGCATPDRLDEARWAQLTILTTAG